MTPSTRAGNDRDDNDQPLVRGAAPVRDPAVGTDQPQAVGDESPIIGSPVTDAGRQHARWLAFGSDLDGADPDAVVSRIEYEAERHTLQVLVDDAVIDAEEAQYRLYQLARERMGADEARRLTDGVFAG